MRWLSWVAVVLALVGVALGVRSYWAAKPGKNVTVMDAESFNREIYQAGNRHEEWTQYPMAVARRFASRQCDCAEATADAQPLGTDRIFRVTVTHVEIPHKMRGHVYRFEITGAGGPLKIMKVTREWLPWSRAEVQDEPEPSASPSAAS